jgi:hypothetical protein
MHKAASPLRSMTDRWASLFHLISVETEKYSSDMTGCDVTLLEADI